MSHRILIADDSQDTLQMLTVFLGFCGWEVCCARTPSEAHALVDCEALDLVILDRWFADEDGVELCRSIRSRLPEVPVIFLSGAALTDDLERATEAGCSAYLTKPCDIDELARIVTTLINTTARKPTPALPV